MSKSSVKSLLSLYLDKVAGGDSSYLSRLAGQLAERLVYVPVVARTDAGKGRGGSIKVEAVCIKEEDRSLVPVFTQEKLMQEWCEARGASAQSINIICADFCGALSADSWIWVDPGSKVSVRLDPQVVERIRQSSGVFSGSGPGAQPETEEAPPSSFVEEVIVPESDMAAPAPQKKRSLFGFLGRRNK